jgi:hypothetical protein
MDNAHSTIQAVRERRLNANSYSVSIGLGDMLTGIPSEAQVKALVWLIRHIQSEVRRIYGFEIPLARTNIVGHYEISPKTRADCPGGAFPFDRIIAELNNGSAPPHTAQSKAVEPVTSDIEQTIWQALKGIGFTDVAVAGVMGNLFAESALRANNLQNSFEARLGHTDESYTAAVDDGSYTNFVRDSAGYGLAQWTFWSRKEALLNFVRERGNSIGDLATQLQFLCMEIYGYPKTMDGLRKAETVREASDVVLTDYLRPADQSEAVQVRRAGYGQGYYDKYACLSLPVRQAGGRQADAGKGES